MSCKLIFAAFHDVSRMVRMLLLKSLIRRKSAHTVLPNGMSRNGCFATRSIVYARPKTQELLAVGEGKARTLYERQAQKPQMTSPRAVNASTTSACAPNSSRSTKASSSPLSRRQSAISSVRPAWQLCARAGANCPVNSSTSCASARTLRTGWGAMAREDGSVNARREPWLRVRTAAGQMPDCLIDTGFDGALMLPRAETTSLNLTVLGRVTIIGVGQVRAIADIAELDVDGLGEVRAVEVIISDGDDSLLGTELLDGSRLAVDYVNYTVTVSNEAR